MEWPGTPAFSARVSAYADQFWSDVNILKDGISF